MVTLSMTFTDPNHHRTPIFSRFESSFKFSNSSVSLGMTNDDPDHAHVVKVT